MLALLAECFGAVGVGYGGGGLSDCEDNLDSKRARLETQAGRLEVKGIQYASEVDLADHRVSYEHTIM